MRPCLRHKNDLHALDLINMTWSPVPVNTEQPLPPARKGHVAALFNGTQMIVFGGSAWVPDPDADNSFGMTSKHVNDVWRIDLSGSDGFTWHAVHTVGDAPSPRELHVAQLVNQRYLVVHGGYSHDDSRDDNYGYKDDVHVLDTHTTPMVWTKPSLSGSIPSARHGHAAIAVGTEIYVHAQYLNSRMNACATSRAHWPLLSARAAGWLLRAVLTRALAMRCRGAVALASPLGLRSRNRI